MESVDELLLYNLRNSLTRNGDHIFSLGHKSIRDLNADDLIRCLGRALRVILQDETIPDTATRSVGLRHRVSLRLAQLVKDQGYANDCGYNNILYPVEAEVRQLLTWITEQLRKAEAERGVGGEEEPPEELDPNEAYRQSLSRTITAWTKRTWIPHALKQERSELPFKTLHVRIPGDFEGGSDYDEKYLPFVSEQCGDVVPTLLERDALRRCRTEEDVVDIEGESEEAKRNEVVEALRTAQRERDIDEREEKIQVIDVERVPISEMLAFCDEEVLPQGVDESEEDDGEKAARERADELFRLQQDLDKLEKKLAATKELVAVELKERLERQNQLKTELEQELADLKRAADIKKKVLKLLPDGEENIVKLEAMLKENRAHLSLLEEEWKSHRDPLLKQKEARARVLQLQEKTMARKKNEVQTMREETLRMDQDIVRQEKLAEKLSVELDGLSKDINRKMYTVRIVDIIKQVRKQDKEIGRVIDDIRELQREINTLSQKLKRTEAVTDDTVFRISDKKKSELSYVKAYRLLTEMRQHFGKLIDFATETGKAKNQARDIETRAQTLSSRLSNSRLEKVLEDLEEIRKENKQLRAQPRTATT